MSDWYPFGATPEIGGTYEFEDFLGARFTATVEAVTLDDPRFEPLRLEFTDGSCFETSLPLRFRLPPRFSFSPVLNAPRGARARASDLTSSLEHGRLAAVRSELAGECVVPPRGTREELWHALRGLEQQPGQHPGGTDTKSKGSGEPNGDDPQQGARARTPLPPKV